MVVHVGQDFVGKSAAHILAAELMHHKHPLVLVAAGDETKTLVTELHSKQYLYRKLPDIPSPKIDSSTPYFNHTKHKQTCLKNRKARKKKKRNR